MWRIFHQAVTESTNSDARAGVPGDVFTADEQTAGRGRLDHRWVSAPGENLTFSAVLDVAGLDPLQVVTLPLVVGLAVAQACEERLAGRQVMLKWPNDVYVDGRKICGILCERQGDAVIAGVGVNVNQRIFPPELAGRATSLANEGAPCEVATVLSSVLGALATLLEPWRGGGFAAVWPLFAARDFLKGRQVKVLRTDDDDQPATGTCGGVQVDGTLLVGRESVFAGEVHVSRVD